MIGLTDANVRSFKIWKFVVFFIVATIVSSVLTGTVPYSETNTMFLVLLLNVSLVLYVWFSIDTLRIKLTGQSMTNSMTVGRWAKYISTTLIIKVLGILAILFVATVILIVFPSMLELAFIFLQQTDGTIATPTVLQFIVQIISFCILTPIWEEVFFRGIVFRRLSLRFKTTTAAVVSSVIFGLMHFGGSSMFHAFLVGVLFCYIYARTQNIWVPIILHGLGNFLSTLALLVPSTPTSVISEVTTDDLQLTLWMTGIPVFILLIILIVLAKKYWPILRSIKMVEEEIIEQPNVGAKRYRRKSYLHMQATLYYQEHLATNMIQM